VAAPFSLPFFLPLPSFLSPPLPPEKEEEDRKTEGRPAGWSRGLGAAAAVCFPFFSFFFPFFFFFFFPH